MICHKTIISLSAIILLCIQSADAGKTEDKKKQKSSTVNSDTISNAVPGFGFLNRIPGQWSGPVFSSTPAGSFKNWHVDFRPVSAGQVSQYSTLDADTVNYLSFFIVKHDNQLKVAMRTEGVFRNKGCVTYEVMDTARESEGYYRFSDFQAGIKRVYTEFIIHGDTMTMKVYTNKFNKVSPLQLHSKWDAALGDRKAASEAMSLLHYPQPVMVKDFSSVFKNMSESIYFTFENDPYPSSSQPHVGTVTATISVDNSLKVANNNELFLLLTTESLFDGLKYNKENQKYISKYVYLPASAKSYTFKNVHPGKYFIYSYIDTNNDKKHQRGDYMSSEPNNTFILEKKGNSAVKTKIDFVIP